MALSVAMHQARPFCSLGLTAAAALVLVLTGCSSSQQSGSAQVIDGHGGAPVRQPAVGGQYIVQRGDTLNKIAAELKAADVSQEQMLAALYRANSDAFVGGNINRLRAGRILKVPEATAAAEIPKREARQIVLIGMRRIAGARMNS